MELAKKRIAYVGIDPGKKGAACLLSPSQIHLHDFESADRAAITFAAWVDKYDLAVVLERVKPFRTDGHFNSFYFGENFGIWQGIIAANFIKPTLIEPPTWQAVYIPGWNKKGTDNKRAAVEVARRLYPSVKGSIYLKKHNGRADALLLATFGMKRGL